MQRERLPLSRKTPIILSKSNTKQQEVSTGEKEETVFWLQEDETSFNIASSQSKTIEWGGRLFVHQQGHKRDRG
jgi:hypothetical protein